MSMILFKPILFGHYCMSLYGSLICMMYDRSFEELLPDASKCCF